MSTSPITTLALGVAAGLSLLATACSDESSGPDTASLDTASIDPEPTAASSATTGLGDEDPALDDRVDRVGDALSNGDFTTMLDLLELSGLSDELEGREITVLAPSEDAFGELTGDELTDLATDPSRAEEVLRRHIIDGLYTYDELAELTEVTTISDETLAVTTDGDAVVIAGATVSPPSVDELAGEQGQEVAVFGIDRLLLDS